VFLEDAGIPEGCGIVNAAGMAHSIVYNDKQIRKDDKLVKGQLIDSIDKGKMHLAVQ
jgi:hypothetical protein